MSVNSQEKKKQKIFQLDIEPKKKQTGNCISKFTSKIYFLVVE